MARKASNSLMPDFPLPPLEILPDPDHIKRHFEEIDRQRAQQEEQEKRKSKSLTFPPPRIKPKKPKKFKGGPIIRG